jgi:PKD repeat protein
LEQPVPTFTFTDNPCSGASVGFTSSVTGTGPYTYSWNFGDGSATSNLQNPSHVFTSLGCGTATFNVTLTITDASGCSNSVVNTITVKQQPSVEYEDVQNSFRQFNNCGLPISSNSYLISVDKSFESSGCISSYSINWGDGSANETVNALPANHTYTTAGIFNLVITASGTNGCNITKSIVVKNIGNPSGAIVNPGNTANLCSPTS